MQDHTVSPVEPQQGPSHDVQTSREYFDSDQQEATMKVDDASPSHEEESDITGFDAPLADTNTRRLSSDDDIPLRISRARHESIEETPSTIVPRERRSIREPVKRSIRQSNKASKKLEPKAWATKPIAKNDMEAKQELIREIEKQWGKGFIKAYIPKCHRPLMKRRKGIKRSMYRDHEADPKKWMPSVLKAVLMIAKLTNDKVWLKRAMNEVVRYRIKHTGNRKPQLVTTDFDVIEDMLVKNWTCEVSFGIRYKHLLMNQHNREETDEDIDHILYASSAGERDSDDERADGVSDEDEDMDIMDEDGSGMATQQELSGGYLQQSGYVQGAPYQQSKGAPKQQPKQKSTKTAKQPVGRQTPPRRNEEPWRNMEPPPRNMHGQGVSMNAYSNPMGYGMPPMSPYGHPMHGYPPNMKGYPQPMYPYGGYGSYGGYGPPMPGKDPRASAYPGMPSYHPHQSHRSMAPSPVPARSAGRASGRDGDFDGQRGEQARFSPFGGNKYPREFKDEETPSFMTTENTRAKIKREPGVEERPIAIDDDYDGPNNYLGRQQENPNDPFVGQPQDENMEDEDDEALEAQFAAAQAAAQLADIRAKMLARKGKSKGGNNRNSGGYN